LVWEAIAALALAALLAALLASLLFAPALFV
jgi:hypothetical protein